ncbi:MAG: hypothetical protein BAJALOKI3v1_50085 [Promethearchaeota archaeon]|nr:MAG: hypothetical protein BAJALOKI3v1_50085 [Candidatus Lokiarchaeota archaeon]
MAKSRFDYRSKSAFKKDIKQSSIEEAEIAIRIAVDISERLGFWTDIIPFGTDYTGEFKKDVNHVNLEPDYIICGVPIEITRSKNICHTYFHEKVAKTNFCIKNNYEMCFVNGFKLDNPKYIMINSEQLKTFTQLALLTYGKIKHYHSGSKPCYKYNIKWFDGLWRDLPPIPNDIPKNYRSILKDVKCQ